MTKPFRSSSWTASSSLLLALLCSSHLYGKDKAGFQWFETNATLIKKASISFCKPSVEGLLVKKIKVCREHLELQAPLRIRLLEGMELKGKTYVGFQFISEQGVITAWSNFRDKASIRLDPEAEVFLTAAPSLPGQQEALTGRWTVEHWGIPKDWPKHSGYLEITPGRHINEFLGKMVVTVDSKHNMRGQIRRGKTYSGFKSTYATDIVFSINGNHLTAVGNFPSVSNAAYAFDLVLEGDDSLTGMGGEMQWPEYKYKHLPPISFRKEVP